MIPQILILVILIGLNAFFAASEIAFISLNDAKIEKQAKEGNKKAKQIEKMLEYVGSKRNIKKLTNHIKEKKVKYDISNIKECIEKLVK